MTNTEKFRDACLEATKALTKLRRYEFNELQANLEYCIGSYDFDKNPSGIYKYGELAIKELKKFKEQNPRKLNKKIIANMQKYLSN